MSRRTNGFTVIEILIAMSLIGIISLFGFPQILNTKAKARAGVVVTHLKAFENALWMYCQSCNHYPAETTPGKDPGFLTNVHSESTWQGPYMKPSQFDPRETPIGGIWDWDNFENLSVVSETFHKYGIAIVYDWYGAGSVDHKAAEYVDKIFDDGNLSTGKWKTYKGVPQYLYVITPQTECELPTQ